MEFRQLECFMVLCKELHFTRAAENLNMSQPSLSQQIKNLESEVGVPLFDRIGKKTALTEAGKVLLVHSQRIFHEIEQAESALSDLNGLRRGRLSIGSLLTCISYLLPAAILKFKHLYPQIELSVLGLRTGDIRTGLLENNLDLGIAFLPVDDEELATIPLLTEELSLAVPLGHPFSKLKEVDMKLLKDIPLVLLPKNYFLRKLIDEYCSEIGITLKPTIEITMESLIQMVSAGIGATILPIRYLTYLKNSQIVTVQLIHPTPQREIGIIYRKDKYMCTATKAFIDQLTETTS
ncbi:LysR substrate-binding domain-containing protein [Bacillus sp. WMMC1349]|uniref:LysR family transcriptional regulator n=1 Tax=Bacillus sp. WMMC1349 TaxID=2736254 RepID=UPI0028156A75|nr:LysR substrate-binding domain-containing protein [Bacillus sp. WMMC1349]